YASQRAGCCATASSETSPDPDPFRYSQKLDRPGAKQPGSPPLHSQEAGLRRIGAASGERPRSGPIKGGRRENPDDLRSARRQRPYPDLALGPLRRPATGARRRPEGMKRLWYMDLERRGDAFALEVRNVFDGHQDDEPIAVEISRQEDVEKVLRACRPLARIPRRYMEVNGLGSILRIASLPKVPAGELIAQTLAGLDSQPPARYVLVTIFQTREEIAACVARGGGFRSRAGDQSVPSPRLSWARARRRTES